MLILSCMQGKHKCLWKFKKRFQLDWQNNSCHQKFESWEEGALEHVLEDTLNLMQVRRQNAKCQIWGEVGEDIWRRRWWHADGVQRWWAASQVSKILPALAGWRGVGGRRLMAKFKKNSILLDSSPKRQVRDRQNCHLNICSCIGWIDKYCICQFNQYNYKYWDGSAV